MFENSVKMYAYKFFFVDAAVRTEITHLVYFLFTFGELKLGTFKGLQDWLFLIANFFSGFTQAIAQE